MASQSVNKQRIVIEIYRLLVNLISEIGKDLLAVYGDSCASNGAIAKWVFFFKDDRETTKDGKYTGPQKR